MKHRLADPDSGPGEIVKKKEHTPIRMGFRKLRLNVSIHWVYPGTGKSPCGSERDDDITTDQYIQDVTCRRCLEVLKPQR